MLSQAAARKRSKQNAEDYICGNRIYMRFDAHFLCCWAFRVYCRNAVRSIINNRLNPNARFLEIPFCKEIAGCDGMPFRAMGQCAVSVYAAHRNLCYREIIHAQAHGCVIDKFKIFIVFNLKLISCNLLLRRRDSFSETMFVCAIVLRSKYWKSPELSSKPDRPIRIQ